MNFSRFMDHWKIPSENVPTFLKEEPNELLTSSKPLQYYYHDDPIYIHPAKTFIDEA